MHIPQLPGPQGGGQGDSKEHVLLWSFPGLPRLRSVTTALGGNVLNDTPLIGCLLFPVSFHFPNKLRTHKPLPQPLLLAEPK